MIELSPYDVLLSPIVSEKTTTMAEANKFVFKISPYADKKTVSEAVALVYKVAPLSVNIANKKGKIKRFKGMVGRRNHTKRAIVTMPENHGIEIVSGS